MSETQYTPPEGSRVIPSALRYRICDGGEIWSSYRKKGRGSVGPWSVVKSTETKVGYLRVSLITAEGRRSFLVHRLVLEAFVGPCPPGMEACHYDDNPKNNFVANLRWDYRTGNVADWVRLGNRTSVVGEKQGRSKLKDEDILTIFRLKKDGYSNAKLAKMFGVTKCLIGFILRRINWSHVPIPSEYIYSWTPQSR